MAVPPVLFLIFNRPGPTTQVLASIRAARPTRLFVAADGPRHHKPGEDLMCAETRRLVDEGIDWPCEVQRLYRSANQGCRLAVSEAISWFFKEVDAGIILEDDCLPAPTFFRFCEELLEHHRDNSQVMHIAGFNPFSNGKQTGGDPSYSYWHFGSIWGWATWRRAWASYDIAMREWPEFIRTGRMQEHCYSTEEAQARIRSFNQVYMGEIDTWDFQWAFARIFSRGLSITPACNLISNIGFGADATHTHDTNDRRSRLTTSALEFPLRHPFPVAPNPAFGSRYWTGIQEQGATPSLWSRIRRKLGRILRRIAGVTASSKMIGIVSAEYLG